MTKKELVIQALEHHETSILPFHLECTEQALENLIAYTGDPNIEKKFDSCLYYWQYWGWPTEIPGRPGWFRDDFGVEWDRNGADKDIGLPIKYQIEDLEDYTYEFPVLDEQRLRVQYQKMMEEKGDRFCMAGFGFVMFERLWSLMGMENALISMIACPEELEAFLDKICDYFCHLIDIALEYDFDGIYFGDDWGQQHGLIMGAEHWRRFIKPRMARMYAKVKAAGKYVMQHSCGDCSEIIPDLIEIGLDCYQTFQPEVYDIQKIKNLYGDKLAFWGGISTQRCLPYATPEEVKQEAQRVATILRKGEGYIWAPTHAIAFDVPPQNILALIELFHKQ